MDYSFTITPGVSPADRHELEDRLEVFLADYDGEVTGGGTFLDGSQSDMDFVCERGGFEDSLKDFLVAKSPFSATFALKTLETDQHIFTIEVTTQKPWWKFW